MSIPEAKFAPDGSEPQVDDLIAPAVEQEQDILEDAPVLDPNDKTPKPEVSFADPPSDDDTESGVDDDGNAVDGTESDGEDWLSDDLAARAAGYGLTADQARAFGAPESLEAAMTAYDQQLFQAGQQFLAQQQQYYYQQQQPQPQQHQPQPQSVDELDLGLDPNDYGEELVSAIGKIKDHYSQRLASLEQHNAMLAQHVAAQRAAQERQASAQMVEEFLGGLESLGEIGAEIFGKDFRKAPQGSPTQQHLARTWDVASALQMGYIARGLQPPSMKELASAAARVAFPQQFDQHAHKQVKTKLTQRQRQFTARPQNAPSKPLSGVERAIRRIDAWRASEVGELA